MSEENNQGIRILDAPLENVIHDSMIPYAEYVIMDRAIPRVEDGLKPVQRRILFSMYDLGITPEKPTRKSARIVGDCLGKYHPHGDSSVYGALVRMGQDFSIRNTLIDGQGNFGSVDGDGAAAMRYTEAKLAPLAMELLRDIDKETVEFTNNFDDTLREPVTLPGRFPNLLVNGAYGIAVGLATNIPTHNLGEVIDGTIQRIKNPQSSLSDIMKNIQGPDFPSGGFIIENDLLKAYETGKGRIVLRAKAKIEVEKDREFIVITEFPYQVNKSVWQQKVIALRETKKDLLLGIQEIVDESDMEGTRVVLKIKKDFSALEILDFLFKKTDLEIGFSINMVAIAGGKPRQMSLLEILDEYIKYQIKVILRRSKFDYEQAMARAHILEGLVVAVRNIDEVVEIIKTSKNTPEAKARLMERFSLDTEQAQAILDMRLARITSMEVYKLEKELEEVRALIETLLQIINSVDKQKEVLISELSDIKKRFADERRSIIIKSEEEAVVPHGNELIVEKCAVLLTAAGEIKKISSLDVKKFASGKISERSDIVTSKIDTVSDRSIRVFTNLGNALQIDVSALQYSKPKENQNQNQNLPIFKELDKNEKIVAVFDLTEMEAGTELLFMTKEGVVKKSSAEEYNLTKDFYQAIKLKEGDEVLSMEAFDPKKELFFATKDGMCLRCETTDIPCQGRVSMGVKGMNLGEGDKVVSAFMCGDAGEIYVATSGGLFKRVIMSHIPTTARYRKGVKLIELKNKGKDEVLSAGYVTMPKTLAVIADTSDINLISTEDVVLEKRETKGKGASDLKFFERLSEVIEIAPME